jgi:hypothetical protein
MPRLNLADSPTSEAEEQFLELERGLATPAVDAASQIYAPPLTHANAAVHAAAATATPPTTAAAGAILKNAEGSAIYRHLVAGHSAMATATTTTTGGAPHTAYHIVSPAVRRESDELIAAGQLQLKNSIIRQRQTREEMFASSRASPTTTTTTKPGGREGSPDGAPRTPTAAALPVKTTVMSPGMLAGASVLSVLDQSMVQSERSA